MEKSLQKLTLTDRRKLEVGGVLEIISYNDDCLLYTSPSPRDKRQSRMPSSA